MSEKSIIDHLKKLMLYRSDTRTAYEKAFEEMLFEEIRKLNPVFHEGYVGKKELANDEWNRSIIWALCDKGKKETVVLLSHFDSVDTTCDVLQPEFDFNETSQWLFGKGSCDMKAGLAIHMHILKQAFEEDAYPNILLLSVPDEESLSEGMRQATQLLIELKKEYQLNYTLAIGSEPHERDIEDTFVLQTGTVGKMMPFVFSKGISAHSACPFTGLNALALVMEIIKAIEQNTEMGDRQDSRITPPPTFLGVKDLKGKYDVTTPEFAVGYFNWLFFKDNISQKFEQLRELCVWSVEDAINQYNYSYNEYLRKQGLPSYKECQDIKVEVIFVEELMKRCDFKKLAISKEHLSLQEQTIELVHVMVQSLNLDHPIVVIGLMPPYYPPVNSKIFYENTLKESLQKSADGLNLKLIDAPYYMGISDLSFVQPMSEEALFSLSNMPLYGEHYSIDQKGLKQISMPIINIGPWGKNMHLKTECVYTKDVVLHVPQMIHSLLSNII